MLLMLRLSFLLIFIATGKSFAARGICLKKQTTGSIELRAAWLSSSTKDQWLSIPVSRQVWLYQVSVSLKCSNSIDLRNDKKDTFHGELYCMAMSLKNPLAELNELSLCRR